MNDVRFDLTVGDSGPQDPQTIVGSRLLPIPTSPHPILPTLTESVHRDTMLLQLETFVEPPTPLTFPVKERFWN